MFWNKDKDKNNYGKLINEYVGCAGITGILLGVIFRNASECVSTILLSVGTSMFATAIVTWINSGYMVKTQRMENLISQWQLHDLYGTKADMNAFDANEALEKCNDSIDIIAEGLSNYISAKGDVLEKKILNHNVKVRIISCDSEEMLKLRAGDELSGGCGDDAVVKVKRLEHWVDDLRNKLGEKKDNIEIRYHQSYPGFSYLKIDKMSFVSVNLWRKPSQQCFALSFKGNGEGSKYFEEYFQDLWNNFAHTGCRLQEADRDDYDL